MARPTQSLPTDTRISAKLRWQLFFSHLLVAGFTWLFFLPFQSNGEGFLSIILFFLPFPGHVSYSPYIFLGLEVIFVAGLIGLLITTNIWLGVHKLEQLLLQLAKGSVTEPLNQLFLGRLGWPFRTLLANLDVILGKITDTTFRFNQLHQARDQWLAQLGEVAAQSERNRLARELHDTIKQQLFSIGASTTSAQLRWENDPSGAKADLATVRQLVVQAQAEMKALLQQLQPSLLDSVGLYDALRDQCEALGYRTGAEVKLRAFQMPPPDRLLAQTEQTIFRVAGEALNNIARHAKASAVVLTLQTHQQDGKEWLTLRVTDDGQGFDTKKPNDSGMGLRGITDRAKQIGAFISVDSVIGRGTTLELWIPLVDPVLAALTPAQVTLETTAQKLHARLTRVTVWSSLAAGATLLIFLLIFSLRSRLTSVSPLAVLKTYLIIPGLSASLLIASYLYVWYAVQRLLGRQPLTTPKAIELASFRNWFSIVLGILSFIIFPSVPFWLDPLIISDSSNWVSLGLALFFMVFTVLGFRGRLRLSQLRYRLATPVQQAEWLSKSLDTLRRIKPYFLVEVYVIGWIVLSSRSLRFPAVTLEDWSGVTVLSLIGFGILGHAMYYWANRERLRGYPLSRRVSWTVLTSLTGLILTAIILFELAGPSVQLIGSFGIPEGSFASDIAWSPDRTKVAFIENGANSSELLVADLNTNTTNLIANFTTFVFKNRAAIYWSDNGQTLNLLDADFNLELRQWSLSSLDDTYTNLFGTHRAIFQELQKDITNPASFLLSPDHQKFLVKLGSQWDLRSLPDGKLLRTINFPTMDNLSTLAWSPDGQKIALTAKSSDYKEIEVFSATDGQSIKPIQAFSHADIGIISNFSWSPDSQTLAVGYSMEPEIRLWNVTTGQLQSTIQLSQNHSTAFTKMFWSPDGQHIAMYDTFEVLVWNVSGKFLGHYITDYSSSEYFLAWSPDGQNLAGGDHQKLLLWRITD